MNRWQYRTMKLDEMRAKRWRLTQAVQTGWFTVAAGTPVTIEYKRGGLTLQTAKCEKCGIMATIRKCPPAFVEEIPDGE